MSQVAANNTGPTDVHALLASRYYAINLNLESDRTRPNPVARTTGCMHGHQTLFLLRLKGVASETRMFVYSLAGQPLHKREEGRGWSARLTSVISGFEQALDLSDYTYIIDVYVH